LRGDGPFSQRAEEVAEDLFAALLNELRIEGLPDAALRFRLDGSATLLEREAAARWIKESVDEGHPAIRYHIEERGQGRVLVNLAAFEDPDSQFYP
jgi:hypothetical protein